jgi:hypothetical protein
MNRRGGLWSWAVCALALGGCISRTELDPDGGETGEGSAGSQVSAGSGGAGGDSGKAGASGKAGNGGVRPSPGSGGKGQGGHGPSGGSAHGGRGGEGGSCSPAATCGGDITGSWTVASACLDVSGVADISALALGCATAAITGSRAVAGTFTANADGTYVDQTTTSGEDQFTLAPACRSISGTLVACDRIGPVFQTYGYDSVSCADAADGGCLCAAVFAQTAGLGVLSLEPPAQGSFTTSGQTLTVNDGWSDPQRYQYCASDGQLELLPISTSNGVVRGSVVLAAP